MVIVLAGMTLLGLASDRPLHTVSAPTVGSAGATGVRALGTGGNASGSQQYQCDGMYWQGAGYWYDPSYCYGHDEPTMSFVSNAPHSGEDATYHLVLPGQGAGIPQANLYAALWFGGVVRDPNSTGGGGQAFLELQFYPAAPVFTGASSGHQDCLPNGAFNPNQSSASLASGEYFSCAVVWQLSGAAEDAAFAGPMDVAGSHDAILVMHAGDSIVVSDSGTAQSTTQGWNLTIHDVATNSTASTELLNGTLALSPYYSTAAAGNTLSWGASNPGAIAFAYEIGHTLNFSNLYSNVTGTCDPGDGFCQSYWPGYWAKSGQMQLQPPALGLGTAATYPTSIGFSSSQGGEAEVNATTCLGPSFSTARNCMYPFFQYQSANYSFTFGTSPVANDTHDYGNEYQFPGNTGNAVPAIPVVGGIGFSQSVRYQAPPVGSVSGVVVPSGSSVDFNPRGQVNPIAVGPSGGFSGRFLEGGYWLNASHSGCTSSSQWVYLNAGATYSPTVILSCTALGAAASVSPNPAVAGASVCYTSYVVGGTTPYGYLWTFGPKVTSSVPDPCHVWNSPGTDTAQLTVSDAKGHKVSVSVAETIAPNWTLSAQPVDVTLYGNNVSTSGNNLPSSFPMSTSFPTGQSDINVGYLFPGPVSPVTWSFSLNQTTAGPVYLDQRSLATAHFFVSLATPVTVTGVVAPTGVAVTIIAELKAGSTILGLQPQTRTLPVTGAVVEYNISFSPQAGVVPSPSGLTLSFTWFMASESGADLSSQLTFHSGAKYPIGVDLPLLAPVLVSQPVLQKFTSTATIRAIVLSPFGTYDLGSVAATLNGKSVGYTSTGGTDFWGFGHLTTGTTYTFVLTATDQQGQHMVVTISWKQ